VKPSKVPPPGGVDLLRKENVHTKHSSGFHGDQNLKVLPPWAFRGFTPTLFPVFSCFSLMKKRNLWGKEVYLQ